MLIGTAGFASKYLHIAAVLMVVVIGGIEILKSVENPTSRFINYSEMVDGGLI